MVIRVILPSQASINKQINKIFRNYSLAVGRAVPLSAKEVAEVVQKEQKSIMNDVSGTLNKTGRPNKSAHTKFSEDIQLMKFSDTAKFSRYDIKVTVPHKYWVEQGSDAQIGLPWSNPSGKKMRNYSNTAFRGYHALERGVNNVITSNLHLQITGKNVIKELMKVSQQ